MTGAARRLNGAWVDLFTSPAPPPTPPGAAFTDTVSNLAVAFNGAGSTAGSHPIASWAWNFGDGATSTGSTTSHTYGTAATFTVTLTVTDTAGLTSKVTHTVATVAPVAPPPPPPSGGGTEPTGSNIVSISTLSGSTITAKLASTPAYQKLVSLPPGTFTFNDFAAGVNSSDPTHSGSGILATEPGGVVGSGIGYSTLKMNPGSTSKSTNMVNGGTTALEYFNVGGNTGIFRDFTLQGVSIGDLTKTASGGTASNGNGSNAANDSPYIYNGFLFQKIANLEVTRVKVAGIPGSDHVNPGETFSFDLYRCSNATFTDCEIDGAGIGATGFGPNFHTGTLTITRGYVHGLAYSSAIAAYQCSGTILLTDFHSDNNFRALNFEQNYAGTVINVVRPKISNTLSSFDMYIGANGSFGSCKVTISDPVDGNGNPLTHLKVWCGATYGGPTNLQNRSDIKVLVGGVDKTSSIVTFYG